MRINLAEVSAAIDGRWDLTVDVPRYPTETRKRQFSNIDVVLATISEIAPNNKRIDRDSLVALKKGRKGGAFLVQISLDGFAETEEGFVADGIGYDEKGDKYEGGMPAWQVWQAVRR
jgi:hypothetical protein